MSLGRVEAYESEDEYEVSREHQDSSKHRAVVRIASQVEKMAEQEQDASRCTSQSAPCPDEVRYRHRLPLRLHKLHLPAHSLWHAISRLAKTTNFAEFLFRNCLESFRHGPTASPSAVS